MPTTSKLEIQDVLSDPRFIAVWQEMQTDPLVLAQNELDKMMKHLRRAQMFLKFDRLEQRSKPSVPNEV
jgi:hypothetical protein